MFLFNRDSAGLCAHLQARRWLGWVSSSGKPPHRVPTEAKREEPFAPGGEDGKPFADCAHGPDLGSLFPDAVLRCCVEGDVGSAWRGLRSFPGNPLRCAWQIKELVAAAEGRGSFSIPPLIRSRIMATMMDDAERVCAEERRARGKRSWIAKSRAEDERRTPS